MVYLSSPLYTHIEPFDCVAHNYLQPIRYVSFVDNMELTYCFAILEHLLESLNRT